MIRVVGKSRLPELAVMSLEQPSPEEAAESRRRGAIFERNMEWYNAHWARIVEEYCGQHICIAGGEIYAGSDPIELRARSLAAHPEEDGCQFTLYLRPLRGEPAR